MVFIDPDIGSTFSLFEESGFFNWEENLMYKSLIRATTAVSAAALLATSAWASDLVVTYDDLNPAPKKAFETVSVFKKTFNHDRSPHDDP